jgi:hypothetical protein
MATLAFHAPSQRVKIDKALEHLDDMRAASKDLSQLVSG